MEPLLLYPDPPPPELAQALDLGGYPWKSVTDELNASVNSGKTGTVVGIGSALACAAGAPADSAVRLDLRQIENIVNETQKMFSAALDNVEMAALLFRSPTVP